MKSSGKTIKGRGVASQIDARYLQHQYEDIDDGWYQNEDDEKKPATTVQKETARSIISRNRSPDIPFEQSINPYRGCEHGCSYCYARPTHAYLDLSPGLDFETRLFAKTNAAELLRKELNKKNYVCSPIALGANTDPYQPIERQYKITRQILEVLSEHNHPFTIVTKSALVLRDLDILAPMAEKNLLHVFISVTTLSHDLARKLEPRATAPQSRIRAIKTLSEAGIATGVIFAPVIPVLNDTEMESVLEKSALAGAQSAGYVMLRLSSEVRPIFKEWLDLHEPLKRDHVLSLIRDIRSGKENDTEYGRRQVGEGNYAKLIAKRFALACRKNNLNQSGQVLNVKLFEADNADKQIDLFNTDSNLTPQNRYPSVKVQKTE